MWAVMGTAWLAPAADAPAPAPLDRAALDKRVYDVLREIHNTGADLYNAGDAAGCYRMFQGAMTAVRPLLDHRPDDQKYISSKLEEAERETTVNRKAFVLHAGIEQLRKQLKAPDAPEVLVPAARKTESAATRAPAAPPKPEQEVAPLPRVVLDAYAVKGKVTFKGQPLATAGLKLIAKGGSEAAGLDARTDAKGDFALAGVKPGVYTLVVTAGDVPEKYGAAGTSPLTIEVAGTDDEIAVGFELGR
jgi:hypothetical protein